MFEKDSFDFQMQPGTHKGPQFLLHNNPIQPNNSELQLFIVRRAREAVESKCGGDNCVQDTFRKGLGIYYPRLQEHETGMRRRQSEMSL